MKKTIMTFLFVGVFLSTLTAYEFLGPKWPGSNPVVTYYLNEKGSQDVTDEWDHLKRSFEVWEDVPGSIIRCEYGGMSAIDGIAPDKKNVLSWKEGADWTLPKNVIAACYYWYTGSTMLDFDIVFNGKDYQWSTTGESQKMDIGHIVTHEVGHALGLDHSQVKSSVMWPYASWGDTTHRRLSSDDSAGIVALYPRTVANNHPPVITSTPITEAIAGIKYTYTVDAYDEDGDAVRFKLNSKPVNMRIDSVTGRIIWYPKFLDLGAHDVSVLAYDTYGGSTQQRFTITVGDLVVYTVDDTVRAGDTLYYKVFVTPMDEYGIVAGNIEFQYNTNEMAVLNVDTVGSVINGVSFVNNISNDMVKVAFAGAQPLSGSGLLFRIKLIVFDEHCGTPVTMSIKKAFFNDGEPVAATRQGTIFMPCGALKQYSIDGKVTYTANATGVGGVTMGIAEISPKDTTTHDGFYCIERIPYSTLPYTVTAQKDSGDLRDAVSAYDASLILRHVVGLHCLNTFQYQKICADVNSNAMITAYDAALVLRMVVGYNDATDIGTWTIVPDKTKIPKFIEPLHNVSFDAYMIGDVSGNWNSSLSPAPPRSTPPAAVSMSTFTPQKFSADTGTIHGYKTTISINKVTNDIYSGEFVITVDNTNLQLYNVKPLELLNGYTCVHNSVGNTIRLAFAGTVPLHNTGNLFDIEIIPQKNTTNVENALNKTAISYTRLNEMGNEAVAITDNTSPNTAALPAVTRINSIYPNPFTTKVYLEYAVAEKQHVSITIYDIKGREVSKPVNGTHLQGTYKILWNSSDIHTAALASQVLMIHFQSKKYTRTSLLYMVK